MGKHWQQMRDILRVLVLQAPVHFFTPTTSPFCIEHLDYRLDNMLIEESGRCPG